MQLLTEANENGLNLSFGFAASSAAATLLTLVAGGVPQAFFQPCEWVSNTSLPGLCLGSKREWQLRFAALSALHPLPLSSALAFAVVSLF